jgi:hypothetical protein
MSNSTSFVKVLGQPKCESDSFTLVPNYFTIGGPYFAFGHGSYTTMVELFINNILQIVKKIQKEIIKSIEPTQEATADFVEHADLWVQRTAWYGNCSSWFKNGHPDNIPTIFPGSRLVLADMLLTPRYEDFAIKHWGKNKFGFLGNGFATIEYDGSDMAWYLGSKENIGGMLPDCVVAMSGSAHRVSGV